jgi:hypothetical protein
MSSKPSLRKKVAIIYGPDIDFNELGFEYYILQLNKLQSIYEFCFPDVDDELFTGFDPVKDDLFTFFHAARDQEKKDVENGDEEQVYIEEGHPQYYIIIIGSKIKGDLFMNWEDEGDTALITTNRWEKDYSPPSVFEYLLNSICSVLILIDKKNDIETHLVTRGCAMDYTRIKDNVKIDATIGYLCDDCQKKIEKGKGIDFLNELKKMVDRAWAGDINTFESVSYNMKKYFKFNIDKDSGFNKSFWEKARDHFDEAPKDIIVAFVGAVVGAVIALLLH